MSRIELKKINKFYGKVHILKDVDLVIEQGDFMTLLGPSGCGKTTTLRVISGLENAQKGTVLIDGDVIADARTGKFAPPAKRNLNLVFQSYALWPHMTVSENVAFGLTVQKIKKDVIKTRVMAALEKMQIDNLAERYPSELSGGQQQRVAIARSIVSRPKILLLDEPLSNLDAKLRVDMRTELKRLHQDIKTTIVYVTHDQVEALTLSTKIAVYFEGVLTQCDTPHEIYNNPRTLKVADFIGNPKINFITGVAGGIDQDNMAVKCDFGELTIEGITGRDAGEVSLVDVSKTGADVTVGIRPEDIAISMSEKEGLIPCKITSILPAGSETLLELELGDFLLMAKEIGQRNYNQGDTVWVDLNQERMNLYENEGGHLVIRTI